MSEMTVSKWGNSLAVRLPAKLVAELGLAEGDVVELRHLRDKVFEIERKAKVREALEKARANLTNRIPADFKFDRDEVNSRGPVE